MRGSLQAKVFAVIALVAVSLVLGLTAYFSRRQGRRHSSTSACVVYVALTRRVKLEPAVALGDERALADLRYCSPSPTG